MKDFFARLFGRAEPVLAQAHPREAAALSAIHVASFNRGWSEQEFEQLLTDRTVVADRAASGRKPVGFSPSRSPAPGADGACRENCSTCICGGWRASACARCFSKWTRTMLRRASYTRAQVFRRSDGVRATMRRGAANRQPRWSCGGTLCNTGPRPTGIFVVTDTRPNFIEAQCMAKGMRMTEQRRVIARVLADSADHPDVEELYRRCAEVDQHISISTVYRTVKLFEDAGIISRHDFREGRARYEQIPEAHHDHLINLRSGEVIEFQSEEIERLQREVARKLGYRLVDHRLELYAVPLDDEKSKR
jgi:Fur family ferric uptake transcriptional regulator